MSIWKRQHFVDALLFICAFSLFSLADAFGQGKVEVEEVNVHGTLVRISPLSITVRTELGLYEVDLVNREFVNLGPARVEVKGEKPLKYLQRGMTVRFQGVLENGRKIREPLAEVTVLDPAAVVALGGGAIRGPGVEGERPDAAEDGGETSQVFIGKVRFYRLGVLSVEVPDERRAKTIQADLADDAVVKLSFGSVSAASPGDQVRVKALQQVGSRLKRLWAEQVTVTSSAESADARLARGAKPPVDGARRAFGDVGGDEPKEADPAGDAVEFEGIILEIN